MDKITRDEIHDLTMELLFIGAASGVDRAREMARSLLHSGWRKQEDPYEGLDLEETSPVIDHDMGY